MVSAVGERVGFGLKDEEDIPHASEQLHQASVSKGNTDDQIGSTQPPCPHIDQAQDEGGQGESRQAQGRRIGDTTVLDLLVETGLKLSSEGRQTLFAISDMSERTVAKASGSFGGLLFVVGHLAIHAVIAIGFYVVVFGGVAGEFGIGVGGHGDGEEIFERPRGVEVEVGLVGGLNRLVSTVITVRVDYYIIAINLQSAREIQREDCLIWKAQCWKKSYMLIAELQEQSINSETGMCRTERRLLR